MSNQPICLQTKLLLPVVRSGCIGLPAILPTPLSIFRRWLSISSTETVFVRASAISPHELWCGQPNPFLLYPKGLSFYPSLIAIVHRSRSDTIRGRARPPISSNIQKSPSLSSLELTKYRTFKKMDEGAIT